MMVQWHQQTPGITHQMIIYLQWLNAESLLANKNVLKGFQLGGRCTTSQSEAIPESKVHGANMGPIWGQEGPGGPHISPIELCYLGCL